MISTRTGRDRFIDGFVVSLLAAACAATLALNAGLSIEPGKILPTALSMRSGEMNENIIAALAAAENDIASIKGGLEPARTWMLITDRNLDPFFLIALLLPQTITKTVLTTAYFIRFGLAAAMMYWFCCRHTGLRRLYSFLLGMMYALSAQVILTAQFAPVMNMVILIPAALSSFDSYLRERTWKAFALSCLSCALITASGTCGCLSGIPFLIAAALILSVSLYSSKRKIFSSWLKLLCAVTAGTAMASFTVIPRFINMVPSFDVVEAFKNAEMRYKFYDLLRNMFVAKSGGIERDVAPVFYIGILTAEALVLFWANLKIPVRIKVTASLILSVWYISCASSFVSEAVSIFGETNVLSASRVICLEIFLFVLAAIALRNIGGVSQGALNAAFLVPLAFLVFSGNSYTDIQFSTTINLATAAAILVCDLFIRHLTVKKSCGKAFKTAFAALGALAVTVNAMFIMFNNTVSATDSEADTSPDIADSIIGDYYDPEEDTGLSVFTYAGRYLILSEDISSYQPAGFADGLNRLSRAALAGDCVENCDYSVAYTENVDHKEGDVYIAGKGFSTLTVDFTCEKGDRIFVYSGFNGDITLRNVFGDNEEEDDLTYPTLVEISADEGKHRLYVYFEMEERTENRIAILRARSTGADKLENATRNISGINFSFKSSELPVSQPGTYSFVTSIAYDPALRVTVNGRICRTFDYSGLLGCVFEASDSVGAYGVQITRTVPGLTGGIAVSAAVCLAIMAIPIIYKYSNNIKKNRKVSGDVNAEQEDS